MCVQVLNLRVNVLVLTAPRLCKRRNRVQLLSRLRRHAWYCSSRSISRSLFTRFSP